MALSAGVSIIYGENDLYPILFSSLITLATGIVTWFVSKGKNKNITKREGYVIVSLVWVVFSLFGALPFYIGDIIHYLFPSIETISYIPSFTNAFFETISGFTTTGASVVNDIEALPHGILFWRSITQWLGGMGIIVLSLAILPLLKIGGMQLFIAEVPGPTPDKLHPRIKETAKRLWLIYLIFTIAQTLLLLLGEMNLFDSICHSFTTMATGGYSTKQASVANFSPYTQYIITLFMFIAGTNFTLSYFGMHGKFKQLWRNEEFRFYSVVVLGFTLLITVGLYIYGSAGLESSFRDSLFQVVSILTTTGFVTADYSAWLPILGVLILILMFFGGSAGSTGGGIKIVRILLVLKNSYLELKRLIHPTAVIPVRYNHKPVSDQIMSNILSFIVFYILIFVIGIVVMSFLGNDLDTSMGAVIACLGNIGPGIGDVGPMDNFYNIAPAGKWFLSFLMLMGRLELFTIIIILSPSFWKK